MPSCRARAGSAAGPNFVKMRSAIAAWTPCAGVVASRSTPSPAARPSAPISSLKTIPGTKPHHRPVLHGSVSHSVSGRTRLRLGELGGDLLRRRAVAKGVADAQHAERSEDDGQAELEDAVAE